MYALNIFTGTWLEAVPFLVLGILFSAAMSVFIPDGFLQRIFPRNIFAGIAFGIVGGFFLPVCDCASVPVYRTLVKKGIPFPAAAAFLTAAPVVNPVVMLSTWYAYNGNLRIVISRTLLGMICSVLTALTFTGTGRKTQYSEKYRFRVQKENSSCLFTGKFSLSGKLSAVLIRSRREFLETGIWQTTGIALATAFQVWMNHNGSGIYGSFLRNPVLDANGNQISLILIMMGLAYCLSLCSTSDAVICSVIGKNLPPVAQLAFLVFGPMMDIKNTILLSGMCSPRLAARMAITTFTICFFVMLTVASANGGIPLL